jgi:hypothetical protein
LQSVRDAVSPLVRTQSNPLEDTGGEELTHDPAEVDVGGKDGTEWDGSDLSGICTGQGLENTLRTISGFVS